MWTFGQTSYFLTHTQKGFAIWTGAISSASFLAGGALAVHLYSKKLEEKYVQISDREIAEAKKFWEDRARLTLKEEEYSTVDKAAEALLAYKDQAIEIEVEEPASSEADISIDADVVNIFTTSEVLTEEDAAERDTGNPYVITQTEFYEGVREYDNTSLTYYEGDDVLCDEEDKPIPNTDVVVGNKNLFKFGHGTSDKNLVHVRNEALELDIEITRSNGTFAHEVMGIEPHIEHEDRPRKFRRYDE